MKLTKRQLRALIKEELESSREEEINEGALDWLQGGLDVVGLIPGIGEAADGINALISLGRGNPLEALLSAISMVPGAGDAVGKGGKIVLKLLDPVMDMIKHGDEAAAIAKKLGPEAIEKSKTALKIIKDAAAKHGPKLKELFKHVKAKDLDAIEDFAGFKVPDAAREKALSALDKVADKLPEADIQSVFKFLAKIDLGDKIVGTDDYKDEIKDDVSAAVEKQDLAAGYIHHQSLGTALLGESYTNHLLEKYGSEIEAIITESIDDALRYTPTTVPQELMDRIVAIDRSDRQDHLWDIVDAIESETPDWTLGMLRKNLEDAEAEQQKEFDELGHAASRPWEHN